MTEKKVLVVDDSEAIRMLMRATLESIGVFVYEAADGEQAIEKLLNHLDIGMIFLDIQMPKMDGMTFLARMNDLNKKGIEKTPIVMLTTHSSKDMVLKAREFGISGWIVKPVKRDLIIQSYERYCLGRSEAELSKPTKPKTEFSITYKEIKSILGNLHFPDETALKQLNLGTQIFEMYEGYPAVRDQNSLVFVVPKGFEVKKVNQWSMVAATEHIRLYLKVERNGKYFWKKVWPTPSLLREIETQMQQEM